MGPTAWNSHEHYDCRGCKKKKKESSVLGEVFALTDPKIFDGGILFEFRPPLVRHYHCVVVD